MKSRKSILQLDEDLIITLSFNEYYLNIIQKDKYKYRINSQQKIIYFSNVNQYSFTSVNFNNDKINYGQNHYVLIFNSQFQWNIYVISKNKQPLKLFFGRIYHEKVNHDGKSNSYVVNVHQLEQNIIVLCSCMSIYKLKFSKQKVRELLKKFNSKETFQPLQISSYVIYPTKNNNLLSQFYLPSLQNNSLVNSLLVDGQKRVDRQGVLYLVFDQKESLQQQKNMIRNNYKDQVKHSFSIFELILDIKENVFMSGKQCLLDIENPVLDLYSVENEVIVQTSKQIYMIKSNTESLIEQGNKESSIQKNNTKSLIQQIKSQHGDLNSNILYFKIQNELKSSFQYSATQFPADCNNKQFWGVICDNSTSDDSHLFDIKLIRIKFKGHQRPFFQEYKIIKNKKCRPIYFLPNNSKLEDSYLFLQNYSIIKLKNFMEGKDHFILQDHSALIKQAQLHQIQPLTNILYLTKKIGMLQQKVIYSNSYIQIKKSLYFHNLPLLKARILNFNQRNDKSISLIFSSPSVGNLALLLQASSSNLIVKKQAQLCKVLGDEQIIELSNNRKIFISPVNITLLQTVQGKQKTTKTGISKLFEGSVEQVQFGLAFQKSSMIVLGLDDQVHVFQIQKDKKMKRKYIHCFNKCIKKMIKLNDINVFSVQFYQNHNQSDEFEQTNLKNSFQIFLAKEDSLTKLFDVQYDLNLTNCQQISQLCTINTVPYYFNFIYGKLIIVSSEQIQKYNPQKTIVQMYQFPYLNNSSQFKAYPLINLSNSQSQINFLLIEKGNQNKQQNNNCRICIGSYSRKNLIRNKSQITFNYQFMVTDVDCFDQRILFACINTSKECQKGKQKQKNIQKYKSEVLFIMTEQKCYNFLLMKGKIILTNLSQNLITQLQSKFLKKTRPNIMNFKGIEELQNPINVCGRQFSSSFTSKQHGNQNIYFTIIYNEFQVWYASVNPNQQQIKLISVFTTLNNQFLQFKNNLTVDQLDDPQFMKLFSNKLPVRQVKYLSDQAVIVLYQKKIVILQIGQHQSLNVRQQVKFLNQKAQNNLHPNQQQNSISQIKIIELLGSYSSTDIYLKDCQERLFCLQLNEKSKKYQIKFDRVLQEDIVCIGRVYNWQQQRITFNLTKQIESSNKRQNDINQHMKFSQGQQFKRQKIHQLIIKKDCQLIIKDIKSKAQKTTYI